MVDNSIKTKIVAPFQFVSSSATGGYVDYVHQNFRNDVSIANNHEDKIISELENSSLQGPFTERHVGGHSHRHLNVNQGTDTARTRPEAYHITFQNSTMRLYSHKFYNSPPSYFIREEGAKRPLNIRNIVSTTSSVNLGNYTHNYQVVQTSGRQYNSLLKNLLTGTETAGTLRTRFVTGTIGGVSLNSLLDNTRRTDAVVEQQGNKTVFVNRFNAPGGINESSRASLDPESEELSANIPLPYRNIKQRLNLLLPLLSQSAAQFDGSYHGVNRNSWRNLAGEFQQDNFFVQRQIPRTDIQYAWISASAQTTAIELGGLQQFSSSYSRGGAFEDIIFKGVNDDRVLQKNRKEFNVNLDTNTLEPVARINLNAYNSVSFPTGSVNNQGFYLQGRARIDTVDYLNPNIPRNPYVALVGGTIDVIGTLVIDKIFTTPIKIEMSVYDLYGSAIESGDFLDLLYSTDGGITWTSYNSELGHGPFENESRTIRATINLNQTIPYMVKIAANCLDTEAYGINSLTTYVLSQSLGEYSHSIWKQLRTGEHPVAKTLKQNNIISVQDNPRTIIRTTDSTRQIITSKRSETVSNFVDPPVSTKYKPIRHKFIFKGNSNPHLGHEVIHTYTNNLSTFANKELINKLGIVETKEQVYDRLLDFYNNPNKEEGDNPIAKLLGYSIEETVYPKEANTGLAKTRGRTKYILDKPGIDRDGYDRQLGTQRVFWRDRLEDRMRSATGSFNFANEYVGKFPNIAGAHSGTYTPSIYVAIAPNSYSVLHYSSHFSSSNINLLNTKNRLSILPIEKITGSLLIFTSSFYGWGVDLDNASAIVESSHMSSSMRQYARNISGELNNFEWIDTFASSSYYEEPSNTNTIRDYLIRTSNLHYLLNLSSLPKKDVPHETSDISLPLTISTIYSASLITEPKIRYCAFLGGIESGSRPYWNDGDPHGPFSGKPLLTQPISSTLDSGLRYAIDEMTDKRPWFDSYEKYVDDIKGIAKDYSVLPEFRISEHMDYYISQNGGNFRAKNNSFLTIDGIGDEYRSSLVEKGLYSDNFFKKYINTDTVKNLQKITKDNNKLTKLDKISFKVSGIKKLLPYNGFYPINRTIQLAGLYSEYINNKMHGGWIEITNQGVSPDLKNTFVVSVDDPMAKLAYKQTALEPLFSPGILFNTVKSGISVDWPAVTGSVTDDPTTSYANSGFYRLYNDNAFRGSSAGATGRYVQVSTRPRIDTRIPFEALLDPSFAFKTKSMITASFSSSFGENESSIYKDLISEVYTMGHLEPVNRPPDRTVQDLHGHGRSAPFAYIKKNSITTPKYSMAMNNFLAETVKFFLNDQKLTTFTSKEEGKWGIFDSSKVYYMDIVLRKDPDLVMIEAYSSSYSPLDERYLNNRNLNNTINGRYFGYPVLYNSTNKKPGSRHQDPAYAPYTPPYFEGESILRVSFSPATTGKYTIDQIFNSLNLKDINQDLSQKAEPDSAALLNKMSINSCINLKGLMRINEVEYDPLKNNKPSKIKNSTDSSRNAWIISPKLETPVLDFSKQPFVADTGSYWVSSGFGRGMWSGYGEVSKTKGIHLSIKESFPLETYKSTTNSGSLIANCGFKAESKKIGQLAEAKEISEAIVIIPYVDYKIPGITVNVEGHNFIKIRRDIFRTQKQNIENGEPAVKSGDFGSKENVQETSISKMIEAMPKYVIPPNYDFLQHNDIPPFAMYFFEFKHVLDQTDLADIWQGVLPEIGRTAELDDIIVEHDTGINEFFQGRELPDDIRWMVFKVKKKAEKNYYAVTADSQDDDRFKFEFQVGRKAPEYSYSWPYDFFSLVEFAKVDLTLDYTSKNISDKLNKDGKSVTGKILEESGKKRGKNKNK